MDFMPILSVDDVVDTEIDEFYGDLLPIIPLRNTILFPNVIVPISVGRESSLLALEAAEKSGRFLGMISQRDEIIEHPKLEDLFTMGTVAKVMKTIEMPDGSTTAILKGIDRFLLEDVERFKPYISAKIKPIHTQVLPDDIEFQALVSSMKDLSMRIITISPNIPEEVSMVLKNMDNPDFLIHFIASNLNMPIEGKQDLLEMDDHKERLEAILKQLSKEIRILELKEKIQQKVRVDLDKQQRDYVLQQQLRTINEELGNGEQNELNELLTRALDKNWPEAAQAAFDKEIKRLKRTNPAAPDYSITLNYIELLLDLPWHNYTTDHFDLKKASDILDKDHYGLDKIKQRILEHLAVLKLKGDMRSPILCFVGPPGVGKTSLGRSIADALGREYVRMSLGGLHDESEIRGHRRTYIGSLPGRLIRSIQKAGSSNPVFILDEVDKISSDFRGDPASALLEVLDPEQNNTFHDNHLEVEYDLSKVMFIATANSLENLHPALRDRMEIIEISGYSIEEKIEIAKRHLIAKQRKAHGLNSKQVRIGKKVLEEVIQYYTRESGVRKLDQKIAALMRAVAKSVAMEEDYTPSLKKEDVQRILGKKRYDPDAYTDTNPAGVAVGLAWTPSGGDILFIETSLSEGKGKLTLTGNLGDVMKESAETAISYMRSRAKHLHLDSERFQKTNIHIHVPEGSIPKDGPSAGITMFTALTSSFTGKKVKPFTAMTGEITLRGKVLPVGGIKEKVLAAKRSGLKHIVLCKQNQVDVEEINPSYISGLQFHYVSHMDEVLHFALQ